MQIPFIPFDVPIASIVILLVFFVLFRDMQRRMKQTKDDTPEEKRKKRGPDMAYSAGRDTAQQNARFQQAFIPMEPEEEDILRAFYLQELGLTEMRAPNYPQGLDGFWAVSGTRQIYFGTQPTFAFDPSALPSFPLANLSQVAEQLATAGYEVAWDTSISYVQRLVVTDPAGTQIALIGA
jgi:hypothetical protein